MTKSISDSSFPAGARDAIDREAADWIARRNGRLSAGEEAEFQRWLSADPRHAAAFGEFHGAWAAIKDPRQAEAIARQLDARSRRRNRRRLFYGVASTGLAAAGIAWMLVAGRPRVAPAASFPTVVLRPDLKTLPDGSTVELNAGAQVDVAFTPETRGIRLLRGGAFFTVAKDKAHPFVVTAGGIEVRAVGTAFSVRSEPEHVDLVVTEGTVTVERAASGVPPGAPGTEPIYVSAGKAATFSSHPSAAALESIPLGSAQAAAEIAWRGQRCEFDGTPLSSAIQLFNRQNRVQLSIADAATGEQRITGIFWTDDPDGFVRLLEKGLNVRAERTPDSIRLGSQ